MLANAGQTVPLEYLIDAIWDDTLGHVSRALALTRQLEYGLLEQRARAVIDSVAPGTG